VVLESLTHGYPLVVVDDGSTDATAETLDGLPVTLLSHPVNRGKGAALKTGFAWAIQQQYDGVVTLDADGQHDPSAISRLLAEADK
jgi:Glycosyltransferases involved in cell wall biogenesis